MHQFIGCRSGLVKQGLSCCLAGVLLFTGGCGWAFAPKEQIRQPVAAGKFYPDNPEELKVLLKKAFQSAPAPVLNGEIKGLLLPHAGYIYSGIIAAMGMQALVKQNIDTVYVVGTAHYADVGGAIIWEGKAFHTPLGDYPVDLQAVRELLKKCQDVQVLPRAWEQEHSVEVQVPFLQVVAPKAQLVPILMGTATWEECLNVAGAIAAQAATRRAVVIASTDLSHYPAWADANVMDQETLKTVADMDPYALDQLDRSMMAQGIPNVLCTVCGLSALKTTMLAVAQLGANQGQLLHYANSGDVTQDKKRVVGYGALAFFKNPTLPEKKIVRPRESHELHLTSDQKQELLRTARAAITETLATGTPMVPTASSQILLERHPVFVTLRTNKNLRGCVGTTEARVPLYQGVAQMACAAAFHDSRFVPLKMNELNETEIEISVLTPLRKIRTLDEIVMGTNGVVVRQGNRSGLFLPQVADETGWNKEEFLDHLCSEKAGLRSKAWQDPGTELYIFTVISFSEKPRVLKP